MDKNDILDYVTKTPGNTNRAVLGGMLDSYAGGGGGGDFSTASVTLTGSGTSLNTIYMPTIVDGIIGGRVMDYCIIMTGVYTVPLGQDGTYITVDADVSSIAGDIEDAGKGHYLITGDCTITIS